MPLFYALSQCFNRCCLYYRPADEVKITTIPMFEIIF